MFRSPPHANKSLKSKRTATRLGLMAAGLLVASSTAAMAGKKVVVMDFQGPNSRSVRAAVVRSLRGNHDVVPRRTLVAEAKKMGFSTQCDANIISGVASVVGAEAVLCGSVARGVLLTLRVYNGGDGKVVRRVRARLGRDGIGVRALGSIIQRIEPALAKTWNWDAVEVKGKKTRASAQRIAAAQPVDELNVTNAVATMPEVNAWESKDEENPLAARPAARAAAPVVRARPEAPRRVEGEHALRLSVGPAMLLRRNFATYHASPDNVAPGWQTTPVAGIAFETEVYPATWFTKGLLTHVGLGIRVQPLLRPQLAQRQRQGGARRDTSGLLSGSARALRLHLRRATPLLHGAGRFPAPELLHE